MSKEGYVGCVFSDLESARAQLSDLDAQHEEALSALLKADARIVELEEKLGKVEAKLAAFESNSRPG